MVSPNDSDGRGRRIGSLGELPRDIAPPRDLWPGIEARLREELDAAGRAGSARRRLGPGWPALAGVAAVVALLGIGIWIGRSLLPAPAVVAPPNPDLVRAAYVTDPRYLEQRAALVGSLQQRLASLPPESREKVAASLATIHQSMKDIEQALGRDPGNVLLQELLVNTYQEEMRVLTAVQEASTAGKEI